MSGRHAIVEISPSRLEAAVVRSGEIIEWRAMRFSRTDWPTPPDSELSLLIPELSRMCSEMSLSGMPATVIYHMPGSVCAAFDCPAGVGTAAAERSARLALANVADFPVLPSTSDAVRLHLDARPAPGREAALAHYLTTADSPDRIARMADVAALAGLDVESLVPADAVASMAAARAATDPAASHPVTAVLYVGEHSSVLAVGTPGVLLFVRTVAAGSEVLAESLTRPLRTTSGSGETLTLQPDEARAVLLSVGIPGSDCRIPDRPTLDGSSLLPHLQPVLQRVAVEIKQSLRFGLPEAQRGSVVLRIIGAGAAIPGALEAIARLAGVAPAENFDPADPGDHCSSTGGLIADLVREESALPSLLPALRRTSISHRRIRKAVAIGAGLAALVIGIEAFDAHATLGRERDRLSSLASQTQQRQARTLLRQQTLEARQMLADIESTVGRSVEPTGDCAALMAVIAERTPGPFRLSNLDFQHETGAGRMIIRGYIRADEAPDPAVLIQRLVDGLSAVPIVASVRLGATQRTQVRSHDAQSFELTVTLVPTPPEHILLANPGVASAHAAEIGTP